MTRLVSVIIPARDERADIERCLERVLAQRWDRGLLEVIVVDGASNDGTAELARRALEAADLRRGLVLENPAGTTPTSLNAGLREALGEFVVRVDARDRKSVV